MVDGRKEKEQLREIPVGHHCCYSCERTQASHWGPLGLEVRLGDVGILGTTAAPLRAVGCTQHKPETGITEKLRVQKGSSRGAALIKSMAGWAFDSFLLLRVFKISFQEWKGMYLIGLCWESEVKANEIWQIRIKMRWGEVSLLSTTEVNSTTERLSFRHLGSNSHG